MLFFYTSFKCPRLKVVFLILFYQSKLRPIKKCGKVGKSRPIKILKHRQAFILSQFKPYRKISSRKVVFFVGSFIVACCLNIGKIRVCLRRNLVKCFFKKNIFLFFKSLFTKKGFHDILDSSNGKGNVSLLI